MANEVSKMSEMKMDLVVCQNIIIFLFILLLLPLPYIEYFHFLTNRPSSTLNSNTHHVSIQLVICITYSHPHKQQSIPYGWDDGMEWNLKSLSQTGDSWICAIVAVFVVCAIYTENIINSFLHYIVVLCCPVLYFRCVCYSRKILCISSPHIMYYERIKFTELK